MNIRGPIDTFALIEYLIIHLISKLKYLYEGILCIVRIKKRKIICILDPLPFLGEEVNLMPCQEGWSQKLFLLSIYVAILLPLGHSSKIISLCLMKCPSDIEKGAKLSRGAVVEGAHLLGEIIRWINLILKHFIKHKNLTSEDWGPFCSRNYILVLSLVLKSVYKKLTSKLQGIFLKICV